MKTMIKKIGTVYKIAVVLIAVLTVVSCKKNVINASQQLTQANVTDTIPMGGGTKTLTFTSNAAWSIDTTGFGWLKLSQTSGGGGAATITLTGAANNKLGASRSLLLVLNATNGQTRRISRYGRMSLFIHPTIHRP